MNTTKRKISAYISIVGFFGMMALSYLINIFTEDLDIADSNIKSICYLAIYLIAAICMSCQWFDNSNNITTKIGSYIISALCILFAFSIYSNTYLGFPFLNFDYFTYIYYPLILIGIILFLVKLDVPILIKILGPISVMPGFLWDCLAPHAYEAYESSQYVKFQSIIDIMNILRITGILIFLSIIVLDTIWFFKKSHSK